MPRRREKAFTLIELLIVIALLAILIIAAIFGARSQLLKSYDAVRKSDLEKIRIALENYFSDKGCYPPQTIFNDCGGADLQPYLNAIPCDPETKKPYNIKLDGTACSQRYYLYAPADIATDPEITCKSRFYVHSPNVPDSEVYTVCSAGSYCYAGYYACVQSKCVLVSQSEKPACAPLFCVSNCQNSCGKPGFEVDPQPCTFN